jgi:hypothetical protein
MQETDTLRDQEQVKSSVLGRVEAHVSLQSDSIHRRNAHIGDVETGSLRGLGPYFFLLPRHHVHLLSMQIQLLLRGGEELLRE